MTTPTTMPAYDTITVPAGQKRSFSVGTGDTFENKLIDMTAPGASAQIHANGSNWTVRNVAFKGEHPGGHYLFTPGVSRGSTATVENLYMGDGQEAHTAKGGIWVNGSTHYGTLNFRNVNIQHFIDNGLYGTDMGYDYVGSHGGVVNVYDSFFDSNNISNIRIGSIDGRKCEAVNCVVRTDSTRPCGVGCSSWGAKNSRGVWAWWGPVEVRDSEIDGSRREQTSRAGNPSIRSVNTNWGSDADTSRARIPDGVPMTAEEAASGTSTGGGSSPSPSPGDGDDDVDAPAGTRFDLVSAQNAANARYSFTVEGTVAKATENDPVAERNDSIAERDGTALVEGLSGNGMGDGFWVDGTVTDIEYDGESYTMYWDGEEVTVDDLPFGGDAPTPTPDPEPEPEPEPDPEPAGERLVTFTSPIETKGVYTYALMADELAPGDDIERHERLFEIPSGKSLVVGQMVAGGKTDSWRVTGDLTLADYDDALSVSVDGEIVDSLETTGGN